MAGKHPPGGYSSSSWKKAFIPIWTCQFFSLLSSNLVQFAIVWWLTWETGSAKILSLGTIMIVLPESLLNPIIGAVVDRHQRGKILIIADLVTAGISIILAGVFIFSSLTEWIVLIALLVRSIAGCFHNNAMISTTSIMVPENQLIRIAGLNQTLIGIMMFVTPPLAAILIRYSSFGFIMMIDVMGALFAVIPLLFIKIPEKEIKREPMTNGTGKNLIANVADGFSYIRKWQGACGMLVISTIVNFIFQPVFKMSAIYVTNVLAGDEISLGYIGGATGIGFIAGGLFLSIFKGHKKKMITSLTGIIGAGTSVLIIGLLPAKSFFLILICFFFAGTMLPVCMSPIQALIQSSVPIHLQGRVFSIMSSASTITVPLSMAFAGVLFDLLSPRLWYGAGGVIVIFCGLTGFTIRKIRNIGEGPKAL